MKGKETRPSPGIGPPALIPIVEIIYKDPLDEKTTTFRRGGKNSGSIDSEP